MNYNETLQNTKLKESGKERERKMVDFCGKKIHESRSSNGRSPEFQKEEKNFIR
jgi:hypothetical protein